MRRLQNGGGTTLSTIKFAIVMPRKISRLTMTLPEQNAEQIVAQSITTKKKAPKQYIILINSMIKHKTRLVSLPLFTMCFMIIDCGILAGLYGKVTD